MDENKHHTGAILSLQFSPDRMYLATGSGDHTCKVWLVSSYQRTVEEIDAERKIEKEIELSFNRQFDVSIAEEVIVRGGAAARKDIGELCAGEVPFYSGYHGDLVHSLRHEAAVRSLIFNRTSELRVIVN